MCRCTHKCSNTDKQTSLKCHVGLHVRRGSFSFTVRLYIFALLAGKTINSDSVSLPLSDMCFPAVLGFFVTSCDVKSHFLEIAVQLLL